MLVKRVSFALLRFVLRRCRIPNTQTAVAVTLTARSTSVGLEIPAGKFVACRMNFASSESMAIWWFEFKRSNFQNHSRRQITRQQVIISNHARHFVCTLSIDHTLKAGSDLIPFLMFFQSNPLTMLEKAKTDLDYEAALREQRLLNDAFYERRRALEEAEWAGLQFAQRIEQEEKDMIMASELANHEMGELERLKKMRQQVAYMDARAALELQQAEARELERLKQSLSEIAQQDANVAKKLQLEEQRIAEQERLRQQKEAEQQLKIDNWYVVC